MLLVPATEAADWAPRVTGPGALPGRSSSDPRRAARARAAARRPWLDRRLGYYPLAIRLNYRHGFHGERMQPGHPNWMLDSDRDSPLPRWSVGRARDGALALQPAPLRAARLLRRMRGECAALVLSNVQPHVVVPFLAARTTSRAADRRARRELGPHRRQGRDRAVLRRLRRPERRRCDDDLAPLPRRSRRSASWSPAGRRPTSTRAGGRGTTYEELLRVARARPVDARSCLSWGTHRRNTPFEDRFVERLVGWWSRPWRPSGRRSSSGRIRATASGGSGSRAALETRRGRRAGGELHRLRGARDAPPALRRASSRTRARSSSTRSSTTARRSACSTTRARRRARAGR